MISEMFWFGVFGFFFKFSILLAFFYFSYEEVNQMYGHCQARKNLFHTSLCTCKNQAENILMNICINGHQSL